VIDAIQIRYSGPVPGSPNLTQRGLNDLVREAWKATGLYWWQHFLPKHFTHEGAQEYGYLPRSGEAGTPGASHFWTSYSGRKQKKFGHTDPLVLSGELRRESQSHVKIDATASSGRSECRVVFSGPQYANYLSPHGAAARPQGMAINIREELTHISEAEALELTKIHDANVQAGLDRLSGEVSVLGFFHDRAA
jgi:hypothetical protein